MTSFRLPKISLLDLCLSVAFIAVVLSSFGWLKHLFSVNNKSERALVLGQPVEIAWERVKWDANHSGASGGMPRLTSDSNRISGAEQQQRTQEAIEEFERIASGRIASGRGWEDSATMERNASSEAEVPIRPEMYVDHQRLLYLSYDDHFGQKIFKSSVNNIGGSFSSKDDYSLFLRWSAGGSKDAHFACDVKFNPKSKVLTLNIKQWFNHKRIAKRASLQYILEEQQFRYLDPSLNH